MKTIIALTLMTISAFAYAEDNLDRLFTSKMERSNLDLLRQAAPAKRDKTSILGNEEEEIELPSTISINGYVKRNDGKKSTVWVNEAPVRESTATPQYQLGKLLPNQNQVPMVITGSGKVIKLKAGQIYVPETDQVMEVGAFANRKDKQQQKMDDLNDD